MAERVHPCFRTQSAPKLLEVEHPFGVTHP